ncbi:MAG: sodium:solute symporter family protein [Lentisphaeria bacterium]|jgi:SSS family solute:Na+ symporter|nr:sodium:solute symporter family protein [Lentisphaeria bacterium]
MAMGLGTIITVLLYLLILGYLGYRGYRNTKTAADYMVAGRDIHPFVMALSYGATFISTSAIVGFGGAAGMFGMSLLWLTVCNIFVGIFVAFVCLGGPTRRMGHHMDAHTFPELLGRRFDSTFIQLFAGLVIFIFIPLYAAAVLIGGTVFISSQFGIDYNVALLFFTAVIAVYVIMGGLKGVMYTDALQGAIMFVGMLILLVATYAKVGGVMEGHRQLTDLGQAPSLFAGIGFQGWTAMPKFGWNGPQYELWWIVVSTLVLGVGIGVLAQPQLAVRFMTVKSKKELNRAVLVGGVFILIMTGVAFTVGSLSNVYFINAEVLTGTVIGEGQATVVAKRQRNVNPGDPKNPNIKVLPAIVMDLDTTGDGNADTYLITGSFVEKVTPLLPKAEIEPAGYQVGDKVTVRPRANAYMRALVKLAPGQYECMSSRIIPLFIRNAMPKWFGLLFLLTLLSAAMSTLSSQFHTLGTSIGRDVFEQLGKTKGKLDTVRVTRIGIVVGILLATVISYLNPGGGYIIARATAIFFGLCASAFLPTFLATLFWKRATRAGAIASMIVGSIITIFWLLLVKSAEAADLGIVFMITGDKPSILAGRANWAALDPLVVALPIALLVLVVVSLLTKPLAKEHVDYCFGGPKVKK